MAKVIWHKDASSPRTHRSTVFARWRLCASSSNTSFTISFGSNVLQNNDRQKLTGLMDEHLKTRNTLIRGRSDHFNQSLLFNRRNETVFVSFTFVRKEHFRFVTMNFMTLKWPIYGQNEPQCQISTSVSKLLSEHTHAQTDCITWTTKLVSSKLENGVNC